MNVSVAATQLTKQLILKKNISVITFTVPRIWKRNAPENAVAMLLIQKNYLLMFALGEKLILNEDAPLIVLLTLIIQESIAPAAWLATLVNYAQCLFGHVSKPLQTFTLKLVIKECK